MICTCCFRMEVSNIAECFDKRTRASGVRRLYRTLTGREFENYLKYASLCWHLIADVIVDRIEAINPTTGCMVILHSRGPFVFVITTKQNGGRA